MRYSFRHYTKWLLKDVDRTEGFRGAEATDEFCSHRWRAKASKSEDRLPKQKREQGDCCLSGMCFEMVCL